MCGRARISSDVSEIKLAFSVPPERPAPNFAANWNAAPTDMLPVVRWDMAVGQRSLDLLRWGLVPYWAKDIKIGYTTINAQAETVAGMPAFREPFRRRRCLVPFDSFYEWRKTDDGTQPYAVARADGRIMAVAGLWDNWRSPQGERVRSFTVVTAAANAFMAPLHGRMPVILEPPDWPAWLGEEPADAARLQALMAPAAEGMLRMWPVDRRVGNVKNNDPSLIAPIAQVS
jgi:putative SOS response-associated peptidase YedK